MLKLHLQNMRLPPQVTTETVLSGLSFCLVSSDVIECSIFPTFVHSPVYKDKKEDKKASIFLRTKGWARVARIRTVSAEYHAGPIIGKCKIRNLWRNPETTWMWRRRRKKGTMREGTRRRGGHLWSFLPSSYKGNYVKILPKKDRFPFHSICALNLQ